MRAEKAFVEVPALVRCRGQAPREEVLFVFAQAADAPELCQRPGDFFFHDGTLPSDGWSVEGENVIGVVKQFNPQKDGGADKDRTCDLLNAIQALYQLSYDPNQWGVNLERPLFFVKSYFPGL